MLILALAFLGALQAQSRAVVPPSPAKTFHDSITHVSFDYPASWTFSGADGEISTFHLDARSAPARAELRAVMAFPENPFPASTFTGGYAYFSVTPHSSATACARQASPPARASQKPAGKISSRPTPVTIADIRFTHGQDEVKDICIVQRDEIYTTRRGGSCLRFDLAINTFCGGEVSGVKDITAAELDDVRSRLQSILGSIRFDP